jgi:hypothetical protein
MIFQSNPNVVVMAGDFPGMFWNLSVNDLYLAKYWGADKSSARPTYRCILFDCENISFDASLVIYIYIYIYIYTSI